MIGKFTIFSSERPAVLGKTFRLESGQLIKDTAGQMSKGSHRQQAFSNVAELAALLANFGHHEALSSSLSCNGPTGTVVSEKLLGSNPGAVTRSKTNFALPDSPGLMILDYDPEDGKQPLTQKVLWAALIKVCPSISTAGVVWWVSGSSCIWQDEKTLKGICGQRVYVLIQSLADTARALSTLNKRLWLEGIGGHVKVSSSGALLTRSLFDAAMGEPARLDFAPAGSVCQPPLEQRRGSPVVLAQGGFLDTRHAVPDLTADDEARYVALVETAKHLAEPAAQVQRLAWKAERERSAMTAAVTAGEDVEEARVRVGRTLDAALGGALLGSFPLIHVDDMGKELEVTVDQVLSDRERWHLCRFLSPIEPDHRDRAADALLYANQPQPVLFDLNDGGTVYRLMKQPARLPVMQGGKAELASQIADALKDEPDLFSTGGQLVRAVRGSFAAVSRPMLTYLIGTKVALYRRGKDKDAATDIDQPTADMVHALLAERARAVTGRASTPLVTTEGRVIDRPGLDKATGIYLDIEPGEVKAIPHKPTRVETVAALRRLWKPWAAYQWATPADRAAMLATVLTIPLRPTIEAAPGLFADAPLQASGKSKAVGAVATVARGRAGGAKTWVAGNEVEVEKWLLSTVRAGESAVTLDNLTGVFDSSCLATAMTEGRVSARLLGVSEIKSHDARLMWLASGNNASLARDMGTRWMMARIDTKSDSPHKLAYPFDPVEAALSDRLGIVRATVIVHRAWHEAGKPRADKINTRFAEWGRVVRQLVLWLRGSGLAAEAGIGDLGDPAASILEGACTADPETDSLAMLLYGLSETFGVDPFTSGEALKVFKAGEDSCIEEKLAVYEGIVGLMPRAKQGITTQSLAAVLRNRRDRPVLGMKLTTVQQFGREAARGAMWRIERA